MIAAYLALAFKIHVVDAATGRPVPMVELRTVNNVPFVTDSNGLIAFDEPGLLGGRTFFHVSSQGYTMKADGFGNRGVALDTRPGGEATIRIERTNVAERIARLTGAGIYRDSVLLGEPTPLRSPVLNGGVLGQDTAQAEVYRGKMMWFWGDTDRASYPLGNFHTSGAVATLPPGGADRGIEYRYFEKDGFVRPMVEKAVSMPIWVSGLVVRGEGASQSLFAYYAQVRGLGELESSGLLKWNDAAERFDIVQTFDKTRGWRFLDGHTVQADDYVMGNDPPNVRVRPDKLLDAAAYEAFTPLEADGSVRRVGGRPDYRWQKTLPPITSGVEARLVAEGKLKPEETHFLPLDPSGKPVVVAGGSVHWNARRKRWIGIFGRKGGAKSLLGEIDYAEADAPTGPFRRAVPIIEHDDYTFYNPVHHAFLDAGNAIYLEGTYTTTFSGAKVKTPRYDYNQILYRLDLDDPRLGFAH